MAISTSLIGCLKFHWSKIDHSQSRVKFVSLPFLSFFFFFSREIRSNLGAGGIPIESELEVDWPIHGE